MALPLPDLEHRLFQPFALRDLVGERGRALPDALLHFLVQPQDNGKKPDHDQIGSQGDQRIPARDQEIGVVRSRRVVADEPGRDADESDQYSEAAPDRGHGEADRQKIKNEHGKLDAREEIRHADDADHRKGDRDQAMAQRPVRLGDDLAPKALPPDFEAAPRWAGAVGQGDHATG